MNENPLPSGKQLGSRIALISAATSIPAVAIVVTYAHLLLDFDATDWSQFVWALLIAGAVSGGYSEIWRRRKLAPVVEWLDSGASDEGSEAKTLAAFSAAVSFPPAFQRMSALSWVFAGVGVPALLSLWGGPGWGLGIRSLVMLVAAVTGALIATVVVLFAVKRELEPVRVELASAIPDAEERGRHIKHISIAHKLNLAVIGSVLTLLVFGMTLSYTNAGKAIDVVAVEWQQRVLASVAAVVEGEEGRSLEDALSLTLPNAELMPYAVTFELLDPKATAVGEDASTQREILARVEEGQASGSRARVHQAAVWAWRVLADGRVLTASIPRSTTRGAFAGFATSLLLLLAVSIGVAWVVASLIAGDMRRSTEALRAAAERMALGDLRRGRILESEDELGDLWRSFERMGSALRATVRSLAVAADRVDVAAGEIASVADGVAGASADQVRRIQQANELMLSINNQVMQVSGSAQALNVSVEESSSSILELGAAGDELNETASVLGSKVDEVSSSIEQMVRSVKQVGASSDGLAEAAAETSASMEEMASAMRAVDTTAAMTADLSRNVVGSAESGQEKVSQTIDGMRAIRDATDTAESVIRGLGARAKEIGAILDVIDDVADETNLLALNAAIIAAQAGEHGRAFSVVADEIKELADRVLASTKEIGGLIRSVQDESENAIGAIEDGSKSVASGVELSAEAGLSLEEITRSSRESGQHIGEIVSAVREQTKAASHVVNLMDKVRGGVEQIAAASTEQDRGNEVVYRSSVTMREVAQQVRRTTEEQSRGFGRIRESVEGVRSAVENINESLQEQSSACSQVAEFLEQVSERTRSNEDAAQQMGESIRSLASQAEALREDVSKFQI